jgi:hypothetical protein
MRGLMPDPTAVPFARTTLGHTLSIMKARLKKSAHLAGSELHP